MAQQLQFNVSLVDTSHQGFHIRTQSSAFCKTLTTWLPPVFPKQVWLGAIETCESERPVI